MKVVTAKSFLAAVALSSGLQVAAIAAQTFEAEAILVSDPESFIPDFEPEPVYGRFAWVDLNQYLWVGRVDPQTGYLVPPDGRGTLLDTQAVLAREFYNGPEWALTDTGPQLVYTKKLSVGYLLAKAYFDVGGWVTEPLQRGLYRYGPYGSLDRGDENARIFYKGPEDPADPESQDAFYWRHLKDPQSEVQFGTRISPTRWIPGYRQLLYTARPGGDGGFDSQVFLLDIDTGEASQITHNSGNKESPRVWTAPDFGNQRLMSVPRNRDVLEIYLEQVNPVDQGVEWVLFRELVVPPEAVGPYIYNARPFVHAGKSYIVMLAMECEKTCDGKYKRRGGLTEVWLTGSLDSGPFWRRISEDIAAFREDPETLEVQGSPYVYISRFEALDGSPSGIYKLATGL